MPQCCMILQAQGNSAFIFELCLVLDVGPPCLMWTTFRPQARRSLFHRIPKTSLDQVVLLSTTLVFLSVLTLDSGNELVTNKHKDVLGSQIYVFGFDPRDAFGFDPQHLHKSGVFLPEATRKQAYQAGKNKVSTYFNFSTLGNTRYTLLWLRLRTQKIIINDDAGGGGSDEWWC